MQVTDPPAPLGKVSAETAGHNSPAAAIGYMASGAMLHVGNVGAGLLTPTINESPIVHLRGKHQKISMPVGTVAEIGGGTWGDCSIELKDIGQEPANHYSKLASYAHVYIDFAGGVVQGGPQTKEVSVNEFKLFKPTGSTSPCVLYCAFLSETRMAAIFIYVLHINLHAKVVDFAVVTIER